jgi:hypothetical protein
MKRIFIAGAFILVAVFVQAQNVGIGTTAPVAKLNIVGIASDPAIPGATSTGVFRIGIAANQGIDFGKQITSPFSAWMQAGFGGSTPDPISLQPLGGNVGIGILSPSAKLHVNGAMKIEGSNTLEFGAGVVGKELNAGKIGYQTFTPGALDIVGAGTTVATRKVNIFAEGGTTFNGPINVSGSTGTTGQVLTSNGTAAPTWTNAAYANSTRFAVDLINNSTFQGDADIEAIRYNLNPADISIGASGITINRSGIYHFNIGWFANASYTVAQTSPLYRIFLDVSANPPLLAGFNLITSEHMTSSTASSMFWRANENVSLEVYIAAPKTIRLSFLIGTGSAISTQFDAYLIGHLISE